LAAAAGPEVAVGATAGLSAVALGAVLRVPMPQPPARDDDAGLLRSVGVGLRLLVTVRPLRAVTVATTVSFTGMGALPVVFPLLAADLGASAAAGGALFSAFALGALAGSLAVAARTPRTGPLRTALVGVLALGVAFGAVALAPTFPAALVLVAVAGAIEGPVLASTLMVRASHSPEHLQTQVVTTAASLKFGGFALGSAGTGLVVATHGVRVGLAALALAQVVGVALGLLALGRRRGPASPPGVDFG
ncbi:MAG: hypothetical protein JWO60_3395, partial [Frankiales bacterium]|nr:hypothetical protein [Frankiales bacterium]